MVYRRFRPRRKLRARSTLSRLTKPMRQTAIQSLAKQVKTLKVAMKKDKEYLNYAHTYDAGVAQDLSYFQLSRFDNWSPVFGTTAGDSTQNAMIWKSSGIDCYLTHQSFNDEEENVTYTAFLVSLRDEIGSAYSPTNGNLSLVANTHYTMWGGLVMLNKKVFKIHRVKRFTLGNFGQNLNLSAGQKQYGNDMRWYWKISPNAKIVNPSGDWKALGASQDPSKAYYVLIFNTNNILDGEYPQLRISQVSTVETV